MPPLPSRRLRRRSRRNKGCKCRAGCWLRRAALAKAAKIAQPGLAVCLTAPAVGPSLPPAQRRRNGGQGFPSLGGEGQLGVNEYSQRGHDQSPGALGGGFGATMGGGGMHGGMGGQGGFHMMPGQGMSMLERQMSSTTLSSEDSSPPGTSWDRLYVSNLPKHFTESDVHRLLSPYGSLLEVTQHKRGDGQSKGCFFVSFASTVEGQQCARALHNCVLPGTQRPMAVRPSTSRRREQRTGGGYGGNSPEGAQPPGGFGGVPSMALGGFAAADNFGVVEIGDAAAGGAPAKSTAA